MGLILDGSVLIDAERRRVDLRQRLTALGDEPVAISVITASELTHGVRRARTGHQRQGRERFVEWILAEIPVAEFGPEEARVHARLWAELLDAGRPVGAHDLLIAATAIALGFRVAASAVRELERIPGLLVDDWSA